MSQSEDSDENIEIEVEQDEDRKDEPLSSDSFSLHLDKEFSESEIEVLGQSRERDETQFNCDGLGKLTFVRNKRIVEKELDAHQLGDYYLKDLLSKNLSKTILSYDKSRSPPRLNKLQDDLLKLISHYKDVLYCERTFDNGEDIRLAYCIHSLNHVLKTRSRVLNHNHRLSQAENSADIEYRDQGFTRPKILILVPFKDCALKIVKLLTLLMFGDQKDETEKRANIMNWKRFLKEFSLNADEEPKVHKKPEDYEKTFSGNIDDAFRVGIAITKKSLKLYAEFYSCDILLASPLGLRTIIGAEGEKERDFDFLSSIEVLILDQADVFLMQNWEHILHIRKHLHLQPKVSHGADFSRIRMWTLEGWSKYYCQTLVFSSICVPAINAFFNKFATNYEGQIISRNLTSASKAPIQRIYVQCPQNFYRFQCNELVKAPDDRFNYFTSTILPKFKDSMMNHTLIYIPSYFDFVRLRNFFRKEEINFTQACEYSPAGKVAKGRSMFYHGARHFMLFTERFHFFHRYVIKGVRHIIFYELPTYPHFYHEMCNLMHPSLQGKKFKGDDSSMSCTVIFSKFDALQLVAILGVERATLMLQSASDFNMIVTEKT